MKQFKSKLKYQNGAQIKLKDLRDQSFSTQCHYVPFFLSEAIPHISFNLVLHSFFFPNVDNHITGEDVLQMVLCPSTVQ